MLGARIESGAGVHAMPKPIPLTPEQLLELRRTARRSPGWICERIHYVRLFVLGYEVADIAELYQVDERTVVTWLERYREGGEAALADRPRSGRPCDARMAAVLEAERCLDGAPEVTETGRTP